MDTDALFAGRFADLERRAAQDDPYELLQIAALLRQLLLDAYPLVDQVNRTHRLPIQYEIAVYEIPPLFDGPFIWSVQDGLDPDTRPRQQGRKLVSKDGFLATVVTQYGSTRYTVEDIIQFGAHVLGAVHAGRPKTDEEQLLKLVNQHFQIDGHPIALRLLKAIARVCLKSWRPLREKVAA